MFVCEIKQSIIQTNPSIHSASMAALTKDQMENKWPCLSTINVGKQREGLKENVLD
jgi:hypothetical protein